MNIRNISPPGNSPVLELSIETPEDSKVLRFILQQSNANINITPIKIETGFVLGNASVKKMRLGYLGPKQPALKLSLKARLLLAMRIIFSY